MASVNKVNFQTNLW